MGHGIRTGHILVIGETRLRQRSEFGLGSMSIDDKQLRQMVIKPALEKLELCYYRQPEALPEAGDIEGQAAFRKQHYNTPLGAGTVSK